MTGWFHIKLLASNDWLALWIPHQAARIQWLDGLVQHQVASNDLLESKLLVEELLKAVVVYVPSLFILPTVAIVKNVRDTTPLQVQHHTPEFYVDTSSEGRRH